MLETLIPMAIPVLAAHLSGVKIQYPDLIWKELCKIFVKEHSEISYLHLRLQRFGPQQEQTFVQWMDRFAWSIEHNAPSRRLFCDQDMQIRLEAQRKDRGRHRQAV